MKVLYFNTLPGRNPKNLSSYRDIDRNILQYRAISPLGETHLLYIPHGLTLSENDLQKYSDLVKVK